MSKQKSYSFEELNTKEELVLVEIAKELGITDNRPIALDKDGLVAFNKGKLIQMIIDKSRKGKPRIH